MARSNNIGTSTGESILSGGKIASNPLAPASSTNSVVSDYMGYGSYSGADVKVIVHIPWDYESLKTAEATQNALKESMTSSQKELESISTSNISTEDAFRIARLRNSIDSTADEISIGEREIEKIVKTPISKELGEVQTFSWSIFREKTPVRTLGSVYPRSFTRGPRTIGGSMVFTVFYAHVLHEILSSFNLGYYNTGVSDHDNFRYTTNLSDQLPPLDISLLFANEYGAISYMGIYGLEFVQEGGTFSIEDIFSESVVQYVARDIDPMRPVAAREIDSHGVSDSWTTTGTNLAKQKAYQTAHLTRRNPYI